MAGVVLVEVGVGEPEQVLEEGYPQVRNQSECHAREVIVAEKRANALPENDQDQQQRDRVRNIQFTNDGNVLIPRIAGFVSPSTKT